MKNCFWRRVRACVLCLVGAQVLISTGHAQTFSITAVPSSLTIYPGQQNVPVTVTLGSSSYTGPVIVTLTDLPSGITATPVTLTAGNSAVLNLSAALSVNEEGFPGGPLIGASPATSWTVPISVVGAAGSAQATSPLSLTISISNPSFAPASGAINLPIVNINTNGVPIIDKTTGYPWNDYHYISRWPDFLPAKFQRQRQHGDVSCTWKFDRQHAEASLSRQTQHQPGSIDGDGAVLPLRRQGQTYLR